MAIRIFNNDWNNFFKKPFYNKRAKRNNIHHNYKNNPSIPDNYLKLLNVKWPSPSVLSNNILLSNSLDVFNYSEKIDGLHTFLLIFDKKIYNVTKNEDLSSIKKLDISNFEKMTFEGDCIIETELYNNIYFIFDVYYLNKVDYSKKYLHERIKAIEPFMQDLGSSFKLKKFHKIPDLKTLLDYIEKDKSPEGNDIDGVILQRIDRPYFVENQNYNSFKLKPLHLNTIDFLLKYNGKDKFSLYLSGYYFSDYFHNFKKAPEKMNVYELNDPTSLLSKDSLRYYKEKLLIYFDNPFYPNLGEFEIDKNWNKNNYSPKYIKLIDELIDKISKNPSFYDNKIVELSLTNDKKWVPVKLRDDKSKPNSYKVGLNNISIIFDPIKSSLNSIYFQKNLSMNDKDQDIIHKINQTFRKYIIEMYVNYYGKYSTVIDLCGGRGADEFNLYSNGVSKFFVIDADTTALKRYFDRSFLIKNKVYENLTHRYKYKYSLRYEKDYITLNFLNHKLDKDYSKIYEDLYSRKEFHGKVDIVIMNFAVHYLCGDEEKIEKLSEFVNNVLYKNGIFIVTYFDGDKILENKVNNISKIGPYNIEIIKEEGNKASAKMPVPTIKSGEDYYIEEPLVLKNMINKLEKYLDLYDEYYVYDKCWKYIDKIYNKEKFLEYYKLIKVAIYQRRNYL